MTSTLHADLKSADALYRAGRFVEAETAYRAVNELDPKNATALERLGLIDLWSNRLPAAEAQFEAALRAMPRYQKVWPLNTQLKYRLGLTYYRQACFAQAARCFREAAGPIALGPFRELKAFAQHMALFADDEPYVLDGPEQSRIDFVVTDPLPVIEVRVNGCRALFFIDTGGAEIILDNQLAKDVGAKVVAAFSGSFGGQQTAATGLGKIESFQVGDCVMRNVPVHTLDVAAMSVIFGGLEIRGIIGTRFLMRFLSTLDYANGALILQRVTPTTTRNLEERIALDRAKVIPFWLAETHYILAWGTVNRQPPTLLLVDTGLAGSGFTASEAVAREAGITVDWSQAGEGLGGGGKTLSTNIVVEQLSLGSGANEVVEHGVPGVVMKNSLAILNNQLGFRVGGVISHQFFRQRAVTFDFAGMRLIAQAQ